MQQKVQEEGSYLGCTGKNYELLEDATGRHVSDSTYLPTTEQEV